jgi:hypothetical protein
MGCGMLELNRCSKTATAAIITDKTSQANNEKNVVAQ